MVKRTTKKQLAAIRQRWTAIYGANEADQDDAEYEGVINPDDVDFGDLLYGFLLGAGVPTQQAFDIALSPEDYDFPI